MTLMIRSLWDRIRPQRKAPITLDPVAQLAIRYLLEFGPRTRESIGNEVSSQRAVIDADLDEALARLVSQGLADARFQLQSEQSQTLYLATKKAARLKGYIPVEPQTMTDFYV
jgi:hypothetical protein